MIRNNCWMQSDIRYALHSCKADDKDAEYRKPRCCGGRWWSDGCRWRKRVDGAMFLLMSSEFTENIVQVSMHYVVFMCECVSTISSRSCNLCIQDVGWVAVTPCLSPNAGDSRGLLERKYTSRSHDLTSHDSSWLMSESKSLTLGSRILSACPSWSIMFSGGTYRARKVWIANSDCSNPATHPHIHPWHSQDRTESSPFLCICSNAEGKGAKVIIASESRARPFFQHHNDYRHRNKNACQRLSRALEAGNCGCSRAQPTSPSEFHHLDLFRLNPERW